MPEWVRKYIGYIAPTAFAGLVAFGAWAVNSYAEDLIDQRVGARLNALEDAASNSAQHDQLQGQKLTNVFQIQVDQKETLKDQDRKIEALQQGINQILIELQRQRE